MRILIISLLTLSNYAFGAPIGIEISPDFFKNNLELILLIVWFIMAIFLMMSRKENHDAVDLTVIMTIVFVGFYFYIK